MWLKEDTLNIQKQLANYSRDGVLINIPGIKTDQLHHYRRLVFNIQLQTMEQAFPIAYSIFETDDWNKMVQDFFLEHDAKTPQIWKLPLEFCEFVKDKNYKTKYGIPFLDDLLLFEWIEIEVHTMKDCTLPEFQKNGDIMEDTLVVNPEFRLNKFDYPIHKIKPKEITYQDQGDYFLLTYRLKSNGRVQFMDLSIFHTFLFEKIAIEGKSISSILTEASSVFKIDNYNEVQKSSIDFVNNLIKKGVILGFQK